MQNKKLIRIICMVIAILMATTVIAPLVLQAAAADKGTEIKQKLDELAAEVKEKDKEIAATENNKKKAQQTRNAYAQKADLQKQQITILTQNIEDTTAALEQKQAEISAKILEIADNKAKFEERLVAIYESNDRSGLSTILGVKDFSQFLRVSENLQHIAKHDTDMLNLMRTQQAELEALAAEIDAQLKDLEQQKAEAERIKAAYEQSMIKAQKDMEAAAALKKEQQKEREATEEERKEYERKWIEWVSQDTQGGAFVGGEFMWPLPGRYSLSSGFGERADNHRGIDIPAPTGTPIYAAAAGTVSTAAHWTYGTCVKISHGGGVVSVYGHMSARAVSDGQIVAKGDKIGYVGSTGQSTGAHLHFEIDEYGTPVNPMKYVTK
ncbi:MAG: peptidoglycan DD-metalloendopeptidase family protein [Oscillospiraceae bacterium]